MFLSQFRHALDDKGRVILPAKWRSALEGGAFVTEYPSGCLAVFAPDQFEEVAKKIKSVSERGATERFMTLSFFSGAVDVVPDKQGRIAIPQHLRDFAQLGAEVVLAGHYDHIEIWNTDHYGSKRGVGTAMLHSDEGIALFSGP